MNPFVFQTSIESLNLHLLALKCVCFVFIILFPYDGDKIHFHKQVIADSYRKKFYGRIPESWITPQQKQEIIDKSRKELEKHWDAQAIKLENYITKDEIHALKCHPPFSMKVTEKITEKEKEKEKTEEIKQEDPKNNNQKDDNQIGENNDRTKMFILIVYPRSYRTIIEDPLEPPPLDYLGNTKLITFYLFKVETKDKEYQEKKKTIAEKIRKAFSLDID